MITSEMRGHMRRLVLIEGWRIETVARCFGVHHRLRSFTESAHQLGDQIVAAPTPTLEMGKFQVSVTQTFRHDRERQRGEIVPDLGESGWADA